MSDKILVLDDELSYAAMLRDLLGEHGFSAEISTDPREALERLHEESYALIVSDFKMPEVDGAQFLTQARSIIPQLPVIMVSGLMTTPDLLKVANIGVTLVLEKPFNVDTFLAYVRRFVTPRGERGQAASPAGSDLSEEQAGGEAGNRDYPPELKYLVDDSEASRGFAASLWEAFGSGSPHVLVQLPSGGEFSEVVKEISAWRGVPGLASFHFSLLELGSPEVRESIRELVSLEYVAPAIAVTLPDGAGFDADQLLEFMHWANSEPAIKDRFTFVYGLPLTVDIEPLLAGDGLSGVAAGPVRMSPLRERLVDLAALMTRFLSELPRELHGSLDPAGATALLHYDWPGNHRELMSVLRRAFNMAPDGVVLKEHVQAAIRSKHGEMSGEGMQLNLESFLLVEQQRFLSEHAGPDADVSTLSELTGIRPDRLKHGTNPVEQPLLFPELLDPDSGSDAPPHE